MPTIIKRPDGFVVVDDAGKRLSGPHTTREAAEAAMNPAPAAPGKVKERVLLGSAAGLAHPGGSGKTKKGGVA